jgi:hypothetical protein
LAVAVALKDARHDAPMRAYIRRVATIECGAVEISRHE